MPRFSHESDSRYLLHFIIKYYFFIILLWRVSQVVRQWSAKPWTQVRFLHEPLKMGSCNDSPKDNNHSDVWLWNQNDCDYSQSWTKRDMTVITVWRTTQIATMLSLRSLLKWFDLPVGLVILPAKVSEICDKLPFWRKTV